MTLLGYLFFAGLAAAAVAAAVFAWRGRQVGFICQISLGADSDRSKAELFDQMIPVLVKDDYRIVAQGGNTTVFERKTIPGWTVLPAIFLFPLGLLAPFLVRRKETVVIVTGEQTADLHGSCHKGTAEYVASVAKAVEEQFVPPTQRLQL